jgi:hypothetical protein
MSRVLYQAELLRQIEKMESRGQARGASYLPRLVRHAEILCDNFGILVGVIRRRSFSLTFSNISLKADNYSLQ